MPIKKKRLVYICMQTFTNNQLKEFRKLFLGRGTDCNKFSRYNLKVSQRHLNLLKPTGHVMHQQLNVQQLYVLPTLYLCVLYLSENKQRLVPLTA